MPHIKDYTGKRAHMIGIGGSSMSGLAGMLVKLGVRVTGSDSARSYTTDALEQSGIHVFIGQRAENVDGADLVIYSAAIAKDNPERMRAEELGIPQMERATLLGQLMEGYRHAINVCGTHGKTTTTSMIAEVMVDTGFDPTVHIGGQLDYIGGSTRVGGHDTFVAEACEFNASFLHFHPTIAVVTNIEEDHLDFYKDLDDIAHAFAKFCDLLPESGTCIGNGDDPRVAALLKKQACRTVSYGFGEGNQWRPLNLAYDDTGCAEFDFGFEGKPLAHVHLLVPGEFNVMHALATMAACVRQAHSRRPSPRCLARFAAPHRRFEYTGTVCGVKLYTDYGHNPAEMHSALENAVHQPHQPPVRRHAAAYLFPRQNAVQGLYPLLRPRRRGAGDGYLRRTRKRPRRYPRNHARGGHARKKAFPRIIPRPSTTRRPICARIGSPATWSSP